MKNPQLRYKTIFISDVHLGTPNCKAREVLHFLKNTSCDRLVLNGDIIDLWQIARGSKWTKDHTRFASYVLSRFEQKDLEVIYLRGNHDDTLTHVLPIRFATMSIVEDYIHETPEGNYLVLHGDVFDSVGKGFTFLSHLGDWGYNMLMGVNRWYNKYRAWRGKDYYSLSKKVKAQVKKAVIYITDFENKLGKLAASRGCVGVICGHIHTAANKRLETFHYLNSGDWVESLSAIVEHHEGGFELVHFEDFEKAFPMESLDSDNDADTQANAASIEAFLDTVAKANKQS